MMHTYFPIILAVVTAKVLALTLFALSSFMAKKGAIHMAAKVASAAKNEPYECGLPSTGTLGERHSVRFYLVALIFLIFDVEVVFLFPWAVVFRDFVQAGSGFYIFYVMLIFLFFLVLGLFYDWRKGGLQWE